MARQKMVAGFVLQQTGVITPNEPITCMVKIPNDATPRSVQIDAKGNFVLFAEVWSHPEGTTVGFHEVEYLICQTKKILPAGSWEYHSTLMAGPAVFHIFSRGKPKIVA